MVTFMLLKIFTIMAIAAMLMPSATAIDLEKYWKANLGNKTYVYGKYDCTQFTNDFNGLLLKIGIKPKIVLGFLHGCGVYGKCLHAWLEIDGKTFEATTGKFITNPARYEFRKYIQRAF